MLDKQFLWPYHSKAAEGSGPPGDVSGRSASGRSAALSGQHGNFQFPNAATDALQGAAQHLEIERYITSEIGIGSYIRDRNRKLTSEIGN